MPFVAFYHTHKLVVILFILIYLIKAILLLSNNSNALAKFSKAIKIPEIIISVLFLITGITMVLQIADFTMLFTIKLVVVVAAIPVAIIAFKKYSKPLAIVAILLLVGAYGLAEVNKARMGKRMVVEDVLTDPGNSFYDINSHGAALFNAQCAVCHGSDGTLQLSGAKNLQVSQVDDQYIMDIINNGKNTMPKMAGKYSNQEMAALVSYIKSLRK